MSQPLARISSSVSSLGFAASSSARTGEAAATLRSKPSATPPKRPCHADAAAGSSAVWAASAWRPAAFVTVDVAAEGKSPGTNKKPPAKQQLATKATVVALPRAIAQLLRNRESEPTRLEAGKNEITKLESDKKKQFGPLVRWLRVNFSDSFIAWIHVKALRVFVESVLRYGLPVNFQAMLLQPSKKTYKKIKDMLDNCYQHLDNQGFSSSMYDANSLEIPGLSLAHQEYYPYVFYQIKLDLIER
ncbi:V-type proton ATPase subunit C 1-like [Stylophora pistillata]|uniref:V-type proton ATPase subunit C 1-like n=1 Tax=Stylophora pistillata TaxID=50429 RepID=UPI000C03B3D0|nr:V-type proton ATPase subunit C 1-like [Stylophora pistillata]